MLKKMFLLVVLVALQGCAYSIHQQYISSMDRDVSYNKGKWVKAEAVQMVILGFAFESDYVNKGYRELEAQCPGRLAQVTTEHLTAYKFLSYEQKVVLQGLCV